MAHSDTAYQTTEHTLLLTMLLSLVLHGVGVAFLHPFQFDADQVTPPLVVQLQRPEPPPPPPPEPEPEPPKPEPPKPQPKPLPPPPVKTPLPPPPERAEIPTPPPPPPPQVIAAAPDKVAEPTFVAPPSEPQPVKRDPEPVVEEVPDLGKYGELLAREFAKHKQYPRLSAMRGEQGTVRVQLDIESGAIKASEISQSSGFPALDRQALETAKKARLFPPLPEELKKRSFTITVPIVFRLE